MNLPSFSVRRPVFTTMVTLIIVILGAVSLSRLRVDLLPEIELPTVTVEIEYEGASPEVVERLVTQVVEEIIATVPGVEEMTSRSREGESEVRVTFVWGTNIDVAAQDLQARIEDEINEMPDDIVRPRINKFDVNSFPVVLLGVSSRLDPIELTELVEDQVRYRFARVPGVAQVDPWGGYHREVRIELDPVRIQALRLPLDEVLTAIRNANLDLPAGRIERGQFEVTLRAPAEFSSLDDIRDTVVAMRDGAPVTLGQVSDVVDSYERLTRHVRINGDLGLRLAIRKQAAANTVEVADRVLSVIDEVNDDFPQITVVPVINQGNFIERSISNVARSVLYGGSLAIFVLLFFLRNVRSTLVISLSIPISAIGTFAMIYFGGFTLNLMTLGGLALGVGMMVDSSIVVLENIFRRQNEENEDPAVAAVAGTNEVGPAIIASTLTTLVIFLPLVFVRGVSGILFQELAYVIVFSLLASLMVSLSLVPMLSSKLLRSSGRVRGASWIDRLATGADAAFAGLDNAYRDLLRFVLRHRPTTIVVALAALGSSLLLVPMIGTEFLPPSDEGEVRVSGEMALGTRLELVDQQTRIMERIIYDAVPEAVAIVISSEGGSGDTAEGQARISLVRASERERSNIEVAEDLRRRLEGTIPGMTIRARAPQGQFVLNRIIGGGEEGITVEVRGYELEVLDALAAHAAEVIADLPGITDVDNDREEGVPQEVIRIDRKKAADLGLSVRDVAEALETAVAGTSAGNYRTAGNSYRILVQLKDAEKLSLDEILDLTLSTPAGGHVALRNLIASAPGRGPVQINRKDQQRLVRIFANTSGRPIGTVAREVDARLDQIPRPVGYEFIITGTYEEQQEAFNELIVSLILALVLVYMVLACQYESFRDPLVVMLCVPFAAIGVLLILFLTNTTLNVQSYIGCIMLGGIVVNNAILLVDQAAQLRLKMGTFEAVAEAGRRRLRPILMTTLTTVLGLVPLALGLGEGSEAQAPLARAVIGGLTGATIITLVFIPVMYSLFHRERKATA